MIGKDDVGDFLMSRRANVTPGQAGLPQDGGDRRVPGLRREEVAMLAGVSTDYYTRLERGDIGNASRSVLEGIARALQLDDVERDHLFDLARNATSDATGHDDTPRSGSVRESVQRLLDNMQVPAVVYNAHQDLVAANLLGRALFAPIFETERPNLARFVFLDSRAPDFYEDWPLACSLTAAMPPASHVRESRRRPVGPRAEQPRKRPPDSTDESRQPKSSHRGAPSCRAEGDAVSEILYMSMSLDGFIARANESPDNSLGDGWNGQVLRTPVPVGAAGWPTSQDNSKRKP